MVVHQECKVVAPQPCVPILSTPSHKQDGKSLISSSRIMLYNRGGGAGGSLNQ